MLNHQRVTSIINPHPNHQRPKRRGHVMAASGVSGTAAAAAVPAGDTEPTEPEIDQVLGERTRSLLG